MMENSSNDKSEETEPSPSSSSGATSGQSIWELGMFLDDTLSQILINTISLRNMNVQRTLCHELNRIIHQKARFTARLNTQLVGLEEEVHKKLVEHELGSEGKIEGIKMEIEQLERKIDSLEQYAEKLGKTIRIFDENQQKSGEMKGKPKKLLADNRENSAVSTPTSSTSSSSSSLAEPRGRRAREWRKKCCHTQDSNLWKLLTPVLVSTEDQLRGFQNQLNFELRTQANGAKSPSRYKLLKMKALEQEIAKCEEKIKTEETHALNIYKSVVFSTDSRGKIQLHHTAEISVFPV